MIYIYFWEFGENSRSDLLRNKTVKNVVRFLMVFVRVHFVVEHYTQPLYFIEDGEWFLWQTEPCRTAITTHCRYKDIPQSR